MSLDSENRGTLQLEGLGSEVQRAVLVVSAMTPVTTEGGYYEYEVSASEGVEKRYSTTAEQVSMVSR